MMAEVEADATRAEPVTDPLVGTVLNGRFHIIKRIARGGMGSVYFATQAPLSRPVAVKVLHVFRDGDAEPEESFRRRFLQEASILAKLQHPNIVMLLDYGQIAGSPSEDYFMAMEFLRGETLAQRFKVQGRLSVAESLGLARQIGRGLREAHRCGFVHRDLKPSNIMLVPEDETTDIVKLVDFGIGKVVSGDAERGAEEVRYTADETRAGILLGSPRYMAPEQIRSEPIEPRTDSYGLGVILFQALTGRVPFDGASFDVLLAHCLTPPPTLGEACPDEIYPECLSQLVRGLLEKEVASRPTVDEFLHQLAGVEEEIFGSVLGSSSQRSAPMALAAGESLSSGSTRPSRRLLAPTLPLDADSRLDVVDAAPPRWSEPPAGTPNRRPAWALASALVGVGALCILVGRLLLSGSFAVQTRSGALHTAGPSAPATTESLASLHHGVDSFPLVIESTPAGATVTEAGNLVGVTPVTLTVTRESVVSAPRRFVVQRDGYSPYALEQGDSDTAVHLHAMLIHNSGSELPSWRGAPSRRRGQLDVKAPSLVDVSSAKRSDGSGLEIRLRR